MMVRFNIARTVARAFGAVGAGASEGNCWRKIMRLFKRIGGERCEASAGVPQLMIDVPVSVSCDGPGDVMIVCSRHAMLHGEFINSLSLAGALPRWGP